MLIEILYDDIGKRVEDIVKDMGYLYFHINEVTGLKKTDHIRRIADDHYNYLLCNEETANYLKLDLS
jgi:hypothetical protein